MIKKTGFVLFIWGVSLAAAAVPDDALWYLSNGAGMLLEKTYKTRALRAEYSVSVQLVKPENAPRELRKYYSAPWQIECRILYENARRVRTQWVFQDAMKTSYLVAAISNDGSGFIEWYDDKGFIVEEQRLAADGSGYFIAYTYRDMYLLKAEAHSVAPALKAQKAPAKSEENAPTAAAAPAAGAAAAAAGSEAAPPAGDAPSAIADEAAPPAAPSAAPAENTPPAAAAAPAAATDAAVPEAAPAAAAPVVKPSERARNPEGPAVFSEHFVAASGKEGPLLWTDRYRYTRSYALRAIEREYHQRPQPLVGGADMAGGAGMTGGAAGAGSAAEMGAVVREGAASLAAAAQEKASRLTFPRYSPERTREEDRIQLGIAPATTFFDDVISKPAAKVTFTTDEKRRIIGETRRDENDVIIGQFTNVWERDRIAQITWTSGDEERRVDFSYNAKGDRILERNYRNGELERLVRIEGEREIEELYLKNETALRAIWHNGKKISEERISNRKIR
jgi:hypothetical protein